MYFVYFVFVSYAKTSEYFSEILTQPAIDLTKQITNTPPSDASKKEFFTRFRRLRTGSEIMQALKN